MIISVPKETAKDEQRVSLTPEVASQFVKDGMEVRVEKNAGLASNYLDESYEEVGAKIVNNSDEIYGEADLILKIQPPNEEEIEHIKEGTVLVCLLWALSNKELVEDLKNRGITALGMEAIPRISRAQNMDVLSSMSSLSGYKAALMGADHLDRYMPMMMTAAGTIPPAKVLVLGAGVAGLQAIATAKRLGAVVEAFDIRPAVKEQVESLGAKFVEVPLEEADTETKGGYAKELSKDSQQRQREVIHEHAKKSDMIITTALIPGKPAPLLVTKEMVEDMKPGSIVVDMAAEQGGNCAETQPGEIINKNDVVIMGPLNIPSKMAFHASKLYAKNMQALLKLLIKEGEFNFDFEDEIIENTTITHKGEIISPMLKDDES